MAHSRRIGMVCHSYIACGIGLSLLICLAIARIHIRVQTTLIGYDIGRLKGDESQLLEERSNLKMQLAKLTTKKHLMLMVETDHKKVRVESLAAK